MGKDIAPVLRLRCKYCGYEPPADSTMEAFQLHTEFEHDTDEIMFDLAVVCTCGASMTLLRSDAKPDGTFRDRFQCDYDGNRTTVRRGPDGG